MGVLPSAVDSALSARPITRPDLMCLMFQRAGARFAFPAHHHSVHSLHAGRLSDPRLAIPAQRRPHEARLHDMQLRKTPCDSVLAADATVSCPPCHTRITSPTSPAVFSRLPSISSHVSGRRPQHAAPVA